jgi:hypothetical protein
MSRLPRDHDDAPAPSETNAGPSHLVHRPALHGHVATRHLRSAAATATSSEPLR